MNAFPGILSITASGNHICGGNMSVPCGIRRRQPAEWKLAVFAGFVRKIDPYARVMKITHNVALTFHPIFIPLNQFLGAILDFGFVVSLCSVIFY